MSRQSILCRSCGKSFDADSGMTRAFCLFCGAENPVPATSSTSAVDLTSLPADPSARKALLEQIAASGGETAATARDRLLFWAARFEPVGRHGTRYGDKFLEFLSTLLFYSQSNASRLNMKRARQDRDRFLVRPALLKAMAESAHPRAMLFQEFIDAGLIYLNACRDDKQYGSKLFALVKMSEREVAVKAAEDIVFGMLDCLCRLDRTPQTDLLIVALHRAYPAVFDKFPDILDKTISTMSDEPRAVLYLILSSGPQLQEDTK